MVKAATSVHPTARKLFADRKLVITTMHGKELAMRPLIKQYLNLNAELVHGIDTDEFGTFSGEIERPFDPLTTLRKKIMKGLQLSGATLGIGNEGSFGPHPSLPFVQAAQEIVMLIDLEHDLEIYESVLSTETNHAEKEIHSINDLKAFARQILFPSHAIILKQLRNSKIAKLEKGIVSWEHLHAAAHQLKADDAILIAETDMRAYLNPTRMKIIEQTTERLLKKVINSCPQCQWPGFACVETKPGLPCNQCGEATRLAIAKVYQCKNCNYVDERYYTEGAKANAMYCDHCNP